MTTFIVSDTHFFHDNILKYNRFNFNNIEQMNDYIIHCWNSTISKNDKVLHLGDFALGQNLEAIENIIKILNGKITLIIGNHDTPKKIKLYSKYFNIASVIKKNNCILTHCPIHPYLFNNEIKFNIHGHIHNNVKIGNNYYNANWDCLETKIETFSNISLNLKEMARQS